MSRPRLASRPPSRCRAALLRFGLALRAGGLSSPLPPLWALRVRPRLAPSSARSDIIWLIMGPAQLSSTAARAGSPQRVAPAAIATLARHREEIMPDLERAEAESDCMTGTPHRRLQVDALRQPISRRFPTHRSPTIVA